MFIKCIEWNARYADTYYTDALAHETLYTQKRRWPKYYCINLQCLKIWSADYKPHADVNHRGVYNNTNKRREKSGARARSERRLSQFRVSVATLLEEKSMKVCRQSAHVYVCDKQLFGESERGNRDVSESSMRMLRLGPVRPVGFQSPRCSVRRVACVFRVETDLDIPNKYSVRMIGKTAWAYSERVWFG